MRGVMIGWWVLVVAATLFAWIPLARAGDMAAAEALFNEGQQLFGAGRTDEACEKFAESQRLDPSPGTLLNLARCHEKQGKTASAWAEYLAAKRAASTAGRSDVAEAAAGLADALAPTLSYLTVHVAVRVDGLQVTRDGVLLEEGALGAKLPVDPGTHRIQAHAPGHEPWSAEVVVAAQESQQLDIPALAPKPRAPTEPAARQSEVQEPEEPRGSGVPPASRARPPTFGYVLGGVGVVALGTGFAFGGMAKGRYDDALDSCPSRAGCSDASIADRDDADVFATVANVAIPVGVAALITGVVLVATHPGRQQKRRAVTASAAWVGGGAFGVLEGSF
ncbi:MAG: hypothetical protein JW751_18795 [Polyangiaceae bacterium]|nr:hypothetical protein [Polyangiaceae bacterium]